MKRFAVAVVLMALATALLLSMTACSNSNPTASETPVPTSTPCAVLGNTASTNTNKWATGYYNAISFTASVDMSVAVIDSYRATSNGYFAVALYTDNGNKPGLKLASSDVVMSSLGWVKVQIPSVTILAGQKIWLVDVGSVYGVATNPSTTTGQLYSNSTTWGGFLATGFPLDLSSMSWSSWANSTNLIYVSSCY